MYIKNFFKHLKKVIIHKTYVAHYCFMCRLYIQGLLHDMSKLSFTEFFESVKYYQGTSSPIDACKADKGYSLAWFHHRGRNRHHWEYWVDDFEKGTIPKKMPFKYVLEMVCDFLGAGHAYGGKSFTMQSEYDWWLKKRERAILNDATLNLVDEIFNTMLKNGIEETLKDSSYINKLKNEYQT